MSLDVRLARPEEYDAVGALTAAAYVDDGLAGGGYAEVLRDAAGRAAVAELLVAVEDEEVLGTVTLVSPDAPEEWRETERADAGTIRMLATAKPARGRGAGTALTVACIERARSHGWRELTLLTQPNMTTAQRLYTRLGFTRDPALDKRIDEELTLWGFSMRL